MKNSQLNRSLQFIRRTGDKALVMDPESDAVFVLMDLDKYEDLLDDLDCASPSDPFNPELDQELDPELNEEEEPIPPLSTTPIQQRPQPSSPQLDLDFDQNVAPAPSPVLSEETLQDVPSEEEEEKFYLEPVE